MPDLELDQCWAEDSCSERRFKADWIWRFDGVRD